MPLQTTPPDPSEPRSPAVGDRSPEPAGSGSRSRIVLILALGLLACLAMASWPLSRPPGPATTAAAESGPPPALLSKFFGFTPDFGTVDDATLNAYYRRMSEGGASWVRFGIYWWYIEKTKGTYTWHGTDRFFAAAACNGLIALPMIIGSPQWASGRSSTIAPPKEEYFPEFKDVIRAVIARYGVGGTYWAEEHVCADGATAVPPSPRTTGRSGTSRTS